MPRLILIVSILLSMPALAQEGFDDFKVVTIAQNLNHPWALDFLPGGDMLVTERAGNLLLLRKAGQRQSVTGLPDNLVSSGQGGLLDVLVHPDFSKNRTIFFSYSAGSPQAGLNTEVARATLNGPRITDLQVIFKADPKVRGGANHFGSRLLWDEGMIYVTLGERFHKMQQAQNPKNHLGTVVRIYPDGSVPPDNPFAQHPANKPEIYTYGNRNVQGIARHPGTGEIWIHEHGPAGGDEINILKAGANYGWPEVSYGDHYSGTPIKDHGRSGYEEPVLHWTPSIAPSGMAFYDGDKFPNWQGDLFVGALAGRHVRHLAVENGKIVSQTRLLEGKARFRDIVSGPDGFLYVLTDSADGRVLRLEPDG